MSRQIQWILLSGLMGVAVAVASAHFPAPIKKLGLFSLALGACVAGLMSLIAGQLGKSSARSDLWLVTFCAALTELGRLAETYRQFRRAALDALQRSLAETGPLGNLLDIHQVASSQYHWNQFLELRYAAFPALSTQPVLCWLAMSVELLLAAGAALVMWRQLQPPAVLQPPTPATQPDEVTSRTK